MKKFALYQHGKDNPVGTYETKTEAAIAMGEMIEKFNDGKEYDPDDEFCVTPFDFKLEEVEVEEEPNKAITNYEEARNYLGGKPNADFKLSQIVGSGNSVRLTDVAQLVTEINPLHVKALIALNKLFTIAQAWNKADNFVPDFSNHKQNKWFPWFVYKKESAGFVYAYTTYTPSNTAANFGSRLCFKTSERARQFGVMFTDLFNEVFLISK